MKLVINKVAVLGAGVMGSGIAAHLANAGLRCLLLDRVPDTRPGEAAGPRNFFAIDALRKLASSKPAQLSSPQVLSLIEVGNFEDDLGRLAECDWVIEVVREDLAIKQALFAKIAPHLKTNAIVSSNTSGLSIRGMTEGLGEEFAKRFLVTHFFNPVRYMKLLELVAGEHTLPEVVATIHKVGEERLGKGIVYGKDTTNFIANRIGVYAMMKTMQEMERIGLKVEEVDAIFGPAMGRAKSAVFRTADLVGLDTLVHVAQNCFDTLPKDEERAIFDVPGFVRKMVAGNLLGEKSGKGFYAKVGKEIHSLELSSLSYQPQSEVRFESLGAVRKIEDPGKRIATVIAGNDKAAELAAISTLATLAYSARRIPEIADDLVNIDRGLRWGFGWELGPFEVWDAIGVQAGVERMKTLGIAVAPWVEGMLATGRKSFYALDEGVLTYWDVAARRALPVPTSKRESSVAILRRSREPLARNKSASAWDMGDGVLLLEFHSKMNAIDHDTVAMMNQAIDIAERDFQGLVIGNDSDNFSAGANLMALLGAASQKQWAPIESLILGFQQANQRMRYSRIPTVAAVAGRALGGGAEVLLGANAVQAALESYVGLVEVGVGVIPGGAGNLELLRNVYGPFANDPSFEPMPFVRKVFLTIGQAKFSSSAEEARELGFLKPSDQVSMNRDFVLADAKALALGLAGAFVPPRPTSFFLPGKSGKATIDVTLYDMEINKTITAHDRLIGSKLATVLTGGDTSPKTPVSEERLLELEREAFLSLCGEPKTLARMEHMLKTGKPLRN